MVPLAAVIAEAVVQLCGSSLHHLKVVYPQPLLRAAALGSANQTLAFPAGTGQSTASICWKRETLRGKAITKAFHCRQMLSVCADFSCF